MLGKCAHTASLASKRFECEVKRESYPSPCRSFRRVVRFFLSPSPWNLRPRSSPSPSRHLFTSPPLPIPIPFILFPLSFLRKIARSGRDWQASISIAERLSPPSLFPSLAFCVLEKKEERKSSTITVVDLEMSDALKSWADRSISDRSGRVSKSYSVTDEIDARCMDPR